MEMSKQCGTEPPHRTLTMSSKPGLQLLDPEKHPSSFTNWDDIEQRGNHASKHSRRDSWRQESDRRSQRPPEQCRRQRTSKCHCHETSDYSDSDTEKCGTHACDHSRHGGWRRGGPSEQYRGQRTSNCHCHETSDNLEKMRILEREMMEMRLKNQIMSLQYPNQMMAMQNPNQMMAMQLQNQMTMQNMYHQFQMQLNQALTMHRAELGQFLQLLMELQRETMKSEIKDVRLEIARDRLQRLEDRVRDSQQSETNWADIAASAMPLVNQLVSLGMKLFK